MPTVVEDSRVEVLSTVDVSSQFNRKIWTAKTNSDTATEKESELEKVNDFLAKKLVLTLESIHPTAEWVFPVLQESEILNVFFMF